VIEDLAERGGAADVTVRGILIDLREGSGLVYRCPSADGPAERRVPAPRRGQRRTGLAGEGGPGRRLRRVTAVFDRELTEALLDKTLDACIAARRKRCRPTSCGTNSRTSSWPNRSRCAERHLRRLRADDDRESAKMLKVDVQAEAREMLEGLEGSA